MEFGLGLMGYHGCWADAAFAEAHGFSTAGFVDSPLLGGDPFACMALSAQATASMRIGILLAVPGNRSAAVTAAGVATVNRIAPGRPFLGLGRVSASRLRAFAADCRALLDGEEVVSRTSDRERFVRLGHTDGLYLDLEHWIPVYVGADGPKALAVAGEVGDGWIVTLQYANVMEDAPDVFSASFAQVKTAAQQAGRSLDDAYTIYSTCVCVLEPGESAVSPRALEQVGMAAMMPFHAYADDPAIAEYLPPPLQDRLEIYEREVLARLTVARDRIYQETHRGHLSHLIEGEAEVLTDEIVRMTTFTGTAEEIASNLRKLEQEGLRNVTFWIPPHLTREVVLDVEQKVMPLLATATA
jgi:alkanesulfonate monooxygenase SsuD/methylene tetrahydromethanopterin reductase-like flavin-dependent oxidoreductase (luciferase family)